MYNPKREIFVIQVRGDQGLDTATTASSKLNFSAMKVFDRFRRILMRFIFSLPSSKGTQAATGPVLRRKSCDRPDPPKTSCSSYYSSSSHYNEAIADCIEFFNKSSQEEIFDGRKSDVMV
ncbi:hypothetical protein RJ640_020863 [Escallonia rubra]|uniref:Uncharacterized protein n=1 Tax=Escallonia rubra TaxID=112253 RepID=A0AA88QN08_9ASTE|nr:hypothetical protein RJ640_020863 [Escallonia rubra]